MAELRDLSDEDRSAYFRGIQPIWGGGLDEARFVLFQRRLADSSDARGRYRLLGWYEEGALTSALKAYDLRGSCAGKALPLLGIGAVYTPPGQRRRGHAAALLRATMAEYRARGARAAVLFSDIDAAYYEKLGFLPLESAECNVHLTQLPKPSGGVRSSFAGDEEQLSRLFAAPRAGETRLCLSRDGWTLRFQLRRLRELARARGVGEPEWGMISADRTGDGAAMLRFGRDTLDVLEAAWTTDGARDKLLGGLRECMLRTGRGKLRVWPAGLLRGLFPSAPRTSAIAMIASLDEQASLPVRGGPAELALLDHL